jgi:hypothetical protein
MGKRNGLAILALLVSFGALGLGVYSTFFLNTSTNQIMQIWTKEQPALYYTTGSYADVPDMDITITVRAGETVLILFNGEFTANVGILIGGVRLMRDNVEIPSSRREFNIETSGGALMGYSITTFALIENLVAGQYEIEVQAFAAGVSDYINEGLLIIYTYK